MAYFPNGTSGMVLDEQCAECVLGMVACPIFAVQMLHNYDQNDNEKLRDAMNLLINEAGVCQMRAELVKVRVPMPDGEHMAFAPDECGCLVCRQDRQGQL